VVERYDYTAYGEPWTFAGVSSGSEYGDSLLVSSVGNPFMHQALFLDPETRTYQNRFRQYDPILGRFFQRDPIGYTDGMSLYEYVGSDPLFWVDPSGQKLCIRGSKGTRQRILKILQKLCPGVKMDGEGCLYFDDDDDDDDDEPEDEGCAGGPDGGEGEPPEPPPPPFCSARQEGLLQCEDTHYKLPAQSARAVEENQRQMDYDPGLGIGRA
jgi:RHS repeat-associated protein